tara:strand:+ start:169 stop:1008 length:840 start_codon:yes stop_codon:yes gene_type:complete
MKLSILVPTFNNIQYLKLLINSLKKNSNSEHEIIIHVNEGSDGTLDYVKDNNLKYSYSKNNLGLCSSINLIAKMAVNDYLMYAHDDMYFCPEWDVHLFNELKKINDDNFYISGTMIEPFSGHIIFNCGETIDEFNEQKLLLNFKQIHFYDHQGSHFAPHVIKKSIWNKIGGFSEEFNPGDASDPDFNMKLWKLGVRNFKGLNDFKVYHFSSVTTRKKKELIVNRGERTFLKKWGISTKFFKKYYLKSGSRYIGPLKEPIKDVFYYKDLLICKIKKIFII